MPADHATAATLLRRHGLPTDALRPVAAGTVNEVWTTAAHVLRVGPASDHAREARLALAALELGIRTARPVAWGEGYGVWERLPGRTAGEAGAVAPEAWRALLDDLARLHRTPLEPPPSAPQAPWRGRPQLVDRTQSGAGWSAEERERLRRALSREHPLRRPAFVHGDAFGANVLVDEAGGYLALLDWGCAGWASLEAEMARLEDEALAPARRRWEGRFDAALLWAMRLDLFLEAAERGRLSPVRVRSVLERCRAAG